MTEASVAAAVVVIGARHGGVIHRALSGSTTRAVLAHARIPVVVVPHDYTAPTSTASTTEPPHPAVTEDPTMHDVLLVLAVVVAVLGPALTVIPLGALRLVVGGLLSVLGLGGCAR